MHCIDQKWQRVGKMTYKKKKRFFCVSIAQYCIYTNKCKKLNFIPKSALSFSCHVLALAWALERTQSLTPTTSFPRVIRRSSSRELLIYRLNIWENRLTLLETLRRANLNKEVSVSPLLLAIPLEIYIIIRTGLLYRAYYANGLR